MNMKLTISVFRNKNILYRSRRNCLRYFKTNIYAKVYLSQKSIIYLTKLLFCFHAMFLLKCLLNFKNYVKVCLEKKGNMKSALKVEF